MATIHIPEAEAAANLPSILAKVRNGEEVAIHNGAEPVVVLSSPHPAGRTISDTIALLDAHYKELGYEPTMDEDFAADMEQIIRNRKPRDTSAWD